MKPMTIDEMTDEERRAFIAEKARREQDAYGKLMKRYPDLHPITLMVLAGDYSNVPWADAELAEGRDWKDVAWQVLGSYARLDWVAGKLVDERIMPLEFYAELPHLWAMSDPDDTVPQFLELWRKAFYQHGAGYIRDNKKKKLPSGDPLTVYRGQQTDDFEFGLSWSLSNEVATKFAKGAWHRVPTEGFVYRAQVARRNVMAYLTERHEQEVIIDPGCIKDAEIVETWKKVRKE